MQLNEDIRDKEVRVIGDDGAQLGIMLTKAALDMAYDKNLDLVKIAPQATPPVCRIMDYGKYKFEQAKREKEARKNQHIVDVKEVRMSVNIDDHDLMTKVGAAIRFLKDGNSVKVTVRFKGRELHHASLGETLLKKFAAQCSEYAGIERSPKLEGRNMSIFLSTKHKAEKPQ